MKNEIIEDLIKGVVAEKVDYLWDYLTRIYDDIISLCRENYRDYDFCVDVDILVAKDDLEVKLGVEIISYNPSQVLGTFSANLHTSPVEMIESFEKVLTGILERKEFFPALKEELKQQI